MRITILIALTLTSLRHRNPATAQQRPKVLYIMSDDHDAGAVSNATVQNIDFAPTMIQTTGTPAPASMQGTRYYSTSASAESDTN